MKSQLKMAEELLEINKTWEQKAEQSEGRAKEIAKMVSDGLKYNKPVHRFGSVHLRGRIEKYAHFRIPSFEPITFNSSHCDDPRLVPIRDNLAKLTTEANAVIDQIHREKQEDVDAANDELVKIAESFGARAKQTSGLGVYEISKKRKPSAKPKTAKRSRKVE